MRSPLALVVLASFAVPFGVAGPAVAKPRPPIISTKLTPAPSPKPKLAVLGIEAIAKTGSPSSSTIDLAIELTNLLKLKPRSRDAPHRAVEPHKDLDALRTDASCTTEYTSCMATIATTVGADLILWGRAEEVTDGHRVTLLLLDGATRKVQRHDETLEPAFATGVALSRWTDETYVKLVGSTAMTVYGSLRSAPPPTSPTAPSSSRVPTLPPTPTGPSTYHPGSTGLPVVLVLGLEGAGRAGELTRQLRACVPFSGYRLHPDEHDLATVKRSYDCRTAAIACMTKIANTFAASYLVYGRLDRRGSLMQVRLTKLDVATARVHVVSDSLRVTASTADVEAWSRKLYDRLNGIATPTRSQAPAKPTIGFVELVASDGDAESRRFARDASAEVHRKHAALRSVRSSCSPTGKPACFASAARAAKLSMIVYGSVEKVGTSFHVTLKRVDVATATVASIASEQTSSTATIAYAVERMLPSLRRNPFLLDLD